MPPPYSEIAAPLRPHQIEDALHDLAVSFPALCTRTTLPGKTAENRSYSYIKIANGSGSNRVAALLVGGVHAREWAPPDALVSFARNLLVAYQAGTDIAFPAMAVTPLLGGAIAKPIKYPSWKISAADVNSIVTNLDLYILPLLNPDGREYDLTNLSEPGWRKNRRPFPSGEIGVDLNRNFDIIWRFEDYFDVGLYKSRYLDMPASTNEVDETYRGPGKHSEPETQNLESLLDSLRIHYFMDVHMAGRHILYSWGLEENGDDPSMNFRLPAFDGKRDGLKDGDPALPIGRTDYKEFLSDALPHRIRSRAQFIAEAMHDRILRSAGINPGSPVSTVQRAHSEYKVGQSAFLYLPASGPNSGCSDDYACSRQILSPDRSPIFAFTLEAGHLEEQLFHCDYSPAKSHFRKINREIQAAASGMLVVAARSPLTTSSGGSGPCFLTMAMMGNAGHPNIAILRSLRDGRLRTTERGTQIADLLNRLYYSISPTLARYLRSHTTARALTRTMLIWPLAAALRAGAQVTEQLGARHTLKGKR